MMSIANTAIIPMQDLLELGPEGRMNRPSMGNGNWEWRLLPQELNPSLIAKLSEMTDIFGRAN
jgi:4-alpha-glucanotransferase